MSSDRISPTAHYTGYVWARAGLSHPELQTAEGRLFYESLRVPVALNVMLGGASLERYLLARHRTIDMMLERAIEEDAVTQVVELACGLSPRGWRFAQRFGDRVDYVEADLPRMAARKRAALERAGSLSAHHRVVDLDALAAGGAGSLPELLAELGRERGLAIITEGLLGYLDGASMRALWERIATGLRQFRSGVYISDLHLGAMQDARIRAFRVLLSMFVRGSVHLHFDTEREAREALLAAGFDTAELTRAAGAELVHIIRASTARSR